MRLKFLALPEDERRLYIEQAAVRRGLSPVILEKDFWVCWLLGILFESEFAGDLVFKGGTSLSKVFDVIERFSEDLDLSVSPAFLNLPEAGTSRNQANKWMTKAEAACGVAVQNQIAPVLESAVAEVLGKRETAWFEFLTDPGTHSPVLLFHYPSTQPAGFEYLKRSVKLAIDKRWYSMVEHLKDYCDRILAPNDAARNMFNAPKELYPQLLALDPRDKGEERLRRVALTS